MIASRALDRKTPVRLRMNVQADVSDRDEDGMNIIGEIPGGAKREIVMIGAHFDSSHSGAGATDKRAGRAVMIEVDANFEGATFETRSNGAYQIVGRPRAKACSGSRAYVKEHFADPKTMHATAEHAKLSGYFNLDNASGKIRGVYLLGHETMQPLFDPVARALSRSRRNDDQHSQCRRYLSQADFRDSNLFKTARLPAHSHHSNIDTYDRAIPEDLMQASAVIAAAVSDAASRKERLPRRVAPKPE